MTKEEAITMLTNTKVYVNGKSREIQLKLFKLGFKWNDLSTDVLDTDYPFIYIRDNMFLLRNNDMTYFKKHLFKEISADDILNIKIDKKFKKGDIISSYKYTVIFNGTSIDGKNVFGTSYLEDKKIHICEGSLLVFGNCENFHLSTPEEKEEFLNALKKEGYIYNEQTKEVNLDLKEGHKFTPFEKVLVRDANKQKWQIDLFEEKFISDGVIWYDCLTNAWRHCIPYEDNEKLLGTANKPED